MTLESNLFYQAQQLKDFFEQLEKQKQYSQYVFLCIGSKEMQGDSLGPLVGSCLESMLGEHEKVTIIGNMKKVLPYQEIHKCIQSVYTRYSNPCIIAIDAALSGGENTGKIVIGQKGFVAGKALGKMQPLHSHITIRGIVGKDEKDIEKNRSNLENAPMYPIIKMVYQIAYTIQYCIEEKVKEWV